MATFHCSVKVGKAGKGSAHSAYISREGKYEAMLERGAGEKLEHVEHGNMPDWARDRPQTFWEMADANERKNGAVYREVEVALPRELTPDQRRELVREIIREQCGDKHAYTAAIHCPQAKIDGGEQPHLHLMYSERTRDGIERDPEQYFKRYNAKAPERGGCQKDSAGTAERLAETRQRVADIQNKHLERHGIEARVDHRSLREQGIDHRQPEIHLGARQVNRMSADQVADLLASRQAEGQREAAQREVSRIDINSSLSAALKEREQHHGREQQAARPEPAAVRQEQRDSKAGRGRAAALGEIRRDQRERGCRVVGRAGRGREVGHAAREGNSLATELHAMRELRGIDNLCGSVRGQGVLRQDERDHVQREPVSDTQVQRVPADRGQERERSAPPVEAKASLEALAGKFRANIEATRQLERAAEQFRQKEAERKAEAARQREAQPKREVQAQLDKLSRRPDWQPARRNDEGLVGSVGRGDAKVDVYKSQDGKALAAFDQSDKCLQVKGDPDSAEKLTQMVERTLENHRENERGGMEYGM